MCVCVYLCECFCVSIYVINFLNPFFVKKTTPIYELTSKFEFAYFKLFMNYGLANVYSIGVRQFDTTLALWSRGRVDGGMTMVRTFLVRLLKLVRLFLSSKK